MSEIFSTIKDNKDLYNNRRDVLGRYSMFPRIKSHSGTEETLYHYIPSGSKVLDFGCDKGSLGFLGFDHAKCITVDGYDPYVDDEKIKYHDLSKVDGFYDYIVFSHVLEHFTVDQIADMLKWANNRCRHVLVAVPNTKNIFSFFYDDLSHVKPIDNASFINFVEQHGYTMNMIIRYDLRLYSFKHWLRVLFNVAAGCDPYYCVIYDFKAA